MLIDDEELFPLSELTRRVLVIGGGIAGIEAALSLAEAGIEVVLVEREPSLGGRMAQLDKLFPNLDHAVCNLREMMVALATHPNVKLLTYAEVLGVEGFAGDFEATIRLKPRKVFEEECTGCGVCWRQCPVQVPSEFHLGMGKRTAIFVPFPQAIPNVPVIDEASCLHYTAGTCRICVDVCLPKCIDFDKGESLVTERFGAIVVATGLSTQSTGPSQFLRMRRTDALSELGHGRHPDVITSLQLERLLSAAGPTFGEVYRPSDGSRPKTIVMVCGATGVDGPAVRSHCSNICCMTMLKQAILLKMVCGRAEVYVVHDRVLAWGKGSEQLELRAREEPDVHFVRCRAVEVRADGPRPIVRVTEQAACAPTDLETDLVVLSLGMVSHEDVGELAAMLGLFCDENGFLTEADSRLRPVESTVDGVFLAGTVSGPRDIAECVAQGAAVAAKVIGLFNRLAKKFDSVSSNVI